MSEYGAVKALGAAVWNKTCGSINKETYIELKKHTVETLFAPVLSKCEMPDDLKKKWEEDIFRQVYYYYRYKYEQSCLPITVPYLILKGVSVAQYYPYPELRQMGDIDVITDEKDYQAACQRLIENGYSDVTNIEEVERGRHRVYKKDNTIVEVHRCFALLNDDKKSAYLDNLIIQNINATHFLPDCINGLVVLEHISQHLQYGLGLRHVIDWMMFVDKCLPDNKWIEFQREVSNIGLEKLAITITRMCELYLGLAERKWCSGADTSLCKDLMDYILSCGNFGIKQTDKKSTSIRIFTIMRTSQKMIWWLQNRGLANNSIFLNSRGLYRIAWIYQAIRYMIKGLGRKHGVIKVIEEYIISCKRSEMFEELGVRLTYQKE